MCKENLAQEVLAYLKDHPHSGDTVEGIVRWWVMRQRIMESVDAVQQALDGLRKDGSVYVRDMVEGRTHYFASDPS